MRKRFKTSKIASSENYELHRKVHLAELQRVHVSVELKQIVERLPKHKKYFVRTFGQEIEITYEDYIRIRESITVIIKEF